MKKRLLSIVLVLTLAFLLAACGCKHEWNAANCTSPKTCVLCEETEGEALGHTWQPATCTEAEKCSACHEEKGKELGHDWQEATTETPKTCSRCALTEGTRIITDSRFTTAATKQLHGQWESEAVLSAQSLGVSGDFEGLKLTLRYVFSNDGKVTRSMTAQNMAEYKQVLEQMMIDSLYAELAKINGMGQEQANQAMQQIYGMTVEEYAKAYVAAMSLERIYNISENTVYYISDGKLYNAVNWDSEFESSDYTLEDGVLIIQEDALEEGGEPLRWTRVEAE